MKYIIIFIVSFLLVYLFYLVTVILQHKKYEKFKSSNQVMFFVNRYKLDVNKISMKKFLKIISFTNSLIVAIAFTATITIKNIYLELLIGLIILIPLMLLSYYFIGKYLKKECQ